MIRIGDDIVIKVIRSGRNSVKIGIDAPADVRVLRAELVERDARSLADYAGDRAPCATHFGK
jgi:carbon storage regulator